MHLKFKVSVLVLLIVGVTLAVNEDETATSGGTTRRPASKPAASSKPCIKHPPNFREVDLPCGGYDKPSCEKVCMKLGHTRAYCKQEIFCLCNSGNLYSC